MDGQPVPSLRFMLIFWKFLFCGQFLEIKGGRFNEKRALGEFYFMNGFPTSVDGLFFAFGLEPAMLRLFMPPELVKEVCRFIVKDNFSLTTFDML